ncbi:hypothetical protein FS842_011148 [Serendipita sp. 407]|nr:hypothetical protein FS842_011148 [Serendipita sp. 407]
MSSSKSPARTSPVASAIQQQQHSCGRPAVREFPNILTPAPTSPMAAATHASALTLTTTVSTTIGGSSTLTSSSNDPSLIRRQPTPHGTVETTKILKTQDSNNPTWKMLNQYRVMRSLGKGTHGTVKYCEDMSKDDPTDPDYAVASPCQTLCLRQIELANLHHFLSYCSILQAIKIIKRMGNRKRLPRADGRDRTNSALSRIRHEVAVMKRCHHDHIVRLIEVIDDPRSLNVFLGTSSTPLPRRVCVLYHY